MIIIITETLVWSSASIILRGWMAWFESACAIINLCGGVCASVCCHDGSTKPLTYAEEASLTMSLFILPPGSRTIIPRNRNHKWLMVNPKAVQGLFINRTITAKRTLL